MWWMFVCNWNQDDKGATILFCVLMVLGNGEVGGDASMVDFKEGLLMKNIRK
jgi:hypothetical protein